MNDKTLVKMLAVMLFSTILHLAFLGAGCWLMYVGFVRTGVACIILSVLVGWNYNHESSGKEE